MRLGGRGSNPDLQGLPWREWPGLTDRMETPCTVQVELTAGQSTALPRRQSPGQALAAAVALEPPAPKWQNSGGSTAPSFCHGDGTAARPQGPSGWPRPPACAGPRDPGCMREWRAWGSGPERARYTQVQTTTSGLSVPRGSVPSPPASLLVAFTPGPSCPAPARAHGSPEQAGDRIVWHRIQVPYIPILF